MTVTGLEGYLEHNLSDSLYATNLRNLIKGKGRYKTVIIDARGVAPLVCQKLNNSAVFQGKQFKKAVKKFIESILSCGSKVVVINGYCPEMYMKFHYFQKKTTDNVIECFENLKMGNDQNFKTFEGILSEYKICASNTLLDIRNDNYEVLFSHETPQKAIIDYIKKKNDYPIVIADNSNFLVYEEIFLYVKARYIDFETLNCWVYDKRKILKFFDLSPSKFPLFATLCGNEIVSKDLLNPFYKKIFRHKCDRFQCIASYIKKSKDTEECIKNLVKEINSKEITEELFKNSLDMYRKNKDFSPSFQIPVLFKTHQFNPNILRVLCFKRCKISYCFENLNDSSVISCRDLFKSLQQKLYGIILFDDNIKNQLVEEHYIDSVVKVEAIPPASYHPGLKILWGSKDKDTDKIKRNLMLKTLSTNISFLKMKQVPEDFFILVLALYYLNVEIPKIIGKPYFNDDFEIKAFLIVGLLVSNSNEQLNSITYKMPDFRALDLSAKFMKCCKLISLLNEACGFVIPKKTSCLCNYFDGLLFQRIYKKLKSGAKWHDFTKNNTSLNQFFELYNDIIAGGESKKGKRKTENEKIREVKL